jgi:hypothetical protein
MRDFGQPNPPPPEETRHGAHVEEARDGMRPADKEEDGFGAAKIVAGVIVGVLILGGALYAYKIATATTPQQQLAFKTPATNHVANDQYPAVAPPAPPPETSAVPATPSMPPPGPPPVRHPVRAARNAASDDAINAPMTLTPDTAPPPQQPADPSRAPTQQAQLPPVQAQEPAAQ